MMFGVTNNEAKKFASAVQVRLGDKKLGAKGAALAAKA